MGDLDLGSFVGRLQDVGGGSLLTLDGTSLSVRSLVELVLVLVAAVWLGGWLQRALIRLAERHGSFNRGSVLTATRLVRWAVLGGGGLIALRIAGVPLDHIALLFSALSIGLGFGLQTIVNNLVSGLILLGERSIRVGDFLDLPSGFRGVVLDISMRSTRLRTPDGTLILVPNSVLVGSTVHNLSGADAAHRQRFDFSVGYGTSKEAVRDAIAAAARAIPATIEDTDHPIEVALKDLGDVTLDYQLVVWVKNTTLMEPYRTRSLYLSAIDDTIAAKAFPQPNPAYDVNLKSGVPPG